jgi:hypothetical protein
MSREPFDQALVDEFERELRDALAIEPSPDFARQVRARIASRRPSRMRWTVGFAAAAVCLLAVGFGMWMRSEDRGRVRVQHAGHRDIHLRTEARVRPTVVPADEVTDTPRTTRVRLRPQPERIAEPEVIVPADRALALARFLELAREGAVTEETLKTVASAAAPATLEIKPLVVAPIALPDIEIPNAVTDGGTDRE